MKLICYYGIQSHMTSDPSALERHLAVLDDNIATARTALANEDYETIRDLQFYRPLRWCLNTYPTFSRDDDVHTVIGHTHRLRDEHIPQEDTDAIESCLDDFEEIVDELRRWNEPVLEPSP